LALIVVSCATFKELEPNPPINSAENGFIELKNDQELFELNQDKQYFMKLPRPGSKDFYIVFEIANKENYKTYLTRQFDDGKGEIIKIEDLQAQNNQLIVFPVDAQVPSFYWVIDRVFSDKLLNVKYRYVPKWRFTYENESQSLKDKLQKHAIDESVFNGFSGFDYMGFDYKTTFNSITQKSAAFKEVETKMNEIASLMPADIPKNDAAVIDYNQLNTRLAGDVKRLSKYAYLLEVFNKFKTTQNSELAFINESSKIVDFLSNKEGYNYDAAIVNEVKKLSKQRLQAVQRYIENDLRNKSTVSPIDYDIDNVANLSQLSAYPNHAQIITMKQFIDTFNSLLSEMEAANQSLANIERDVSQTVKWPSNSFYSNVAGKLSDVEDKLKSIDMTKLDPYATYNCVHLIKSSVNSSLRRISSNRTLYARAALVVAEINTLRPTNQYKAMIDLLQRNSNLTFLRNQYSDLDELSMNQQKAEIDLAMNRGNFAEAETKLRNFYTDQSYLNPTESRPKKNQLVKDSENHFYQQILSQSKNKADSLVNLNYQQYTGVKELYDDAGFRPIYTPTFNSAGPDEASRRMAALQSDLDKVKTITFPEKAVEYLYSSFVKNIRDNGVAKAKSIVVHGDNYKGNNARIWRMVNECDPRRGKQLAKPAEYRKVYSIPVNNEKTGSNEYIVKINLDFQSTAKFPVYEFNIKLPDEVGGNSSKSQWFDYLKMNGKEIKNEGRITIAAPTSAN
ncbi:MAG: hypothetical protein KDD94_12825, partial [Calditrichaeota bacterium]|nr:hypothetical protein [Calditrichota bacterium]